jgi:hypothetical protein
MPRLATGGSTHAMPDFMVKHLSAIACPALLDKGAGHASGNQ